MPGLMYNSKYDNYDSSKTTTLLNTVNDKIKNEYDINNTNKTKSLNNIHTYKKYKSLNYILFIILSLIISILLLTILHNNVQYFDSTSYVITISIIISIGCIYIFQLIMDVLFRNNLNYDEYNFKMSEKPTIMYNKGPNMTYSKNDNKCNKK
jgi:hypothetical protein